MNLFVGSTNPVKINSIVMAASEQWPDLVAKGYSVPSGIPEQPMTDSETKLGSINRAKGALEMGMKERNIEYKYREKAVQNSGKAKGLKYSKTQVLGIGMEGGVFLNEDNELWSTVWVTVVDIEGNMFSSNGARFKVPAKIADPILAGGEMGPIVGKFFKDPTIKQKQGAIGVITQGFVDRTEEYTGIAKLALGLWYGMGWEEKI